MKQIQDFSYRDSEGKKHKIKIIHQDEHILAINKPARLRVIPDHWIPNLPNLRDLLQQKLSSLYKKNEQFVWVIHRIDADTSGLVIFARNPYAHQTLNKAFEENQIQKTYLAIVQGCPEQSEGEINLPIDTKRRSKGRVRIHPEGKPSSTKYRVIEKFRDFALLEVLPQTGRTHQIRIHLQYIGHPLAIDPLYNKTDKITISQLRGKWIKTASNEENAIISRLSLHAYKLKFPHPETGKLLQLEAETPKDFNAFYKALKKWNTKI